MFRIRRVYEANSPVNQAAIARVREILREQFDQLRQSEVDSLPEKLKNPLKYKLRSILFIADNMHGQVSGFALLQHAPDLGFCYLDYISAAKNYTGRGIGGALYERVRNEAMLLKASGLFFECLPDDPALCRDPAVLKQNASRLRFYEKYGARPFLGTAYETPVTPGDDNPPYLVVDPLDHSGQYSNSQMQEIVRAILKRKYPEICDAKYVQMVVASFRDNPVRIRPPRYVREQSFTSPEIPPDRKITLVVNTLHTIHHVRDRGYVEAPVRVKAILSSLEKSRLFTLIPSRQFPEYHITAVHDKGFVAYLKTVCTSLPEKESVYPYVFPIRNNTRPPRELAMRAGYYCIDTFTPLNGNAWKAARAAVDCTLTAARAVREGCHLAYALVRPPGHHAEQNVFGGFCYFNSNAIAAAYLSQYGRVAILDIDYHHGNGQQSIFYHRDDILTISLHGHPSFAYPFFSGFAEERGIGPGKGYNVNYPLPETITADYYISILKKAVSHIKQFDPVFLIVALGLDTAQGDPTGTWPLRADDFMRAGGIIGSLPPAKLFVQEGGYETKTIGKNARSFFQGVWDSSFRPLGD